MSELAPITRPAGTFEWVKEHRRLYLRSGGAQGHIMDITGAGGFAFGTHCLIRYRGRKSGRTMIQGLTYGAYAGEVVICASRGGADQPPQWYHNIRAAGTVDYQIATQAFRASLARAGGRGAGKGLGLHGRLLSVLRRVPDADRAAASACHDEGHRADPGV